MVFRPRFSGIPESCICTRRNDRGTDLRCTAVVKQMCRMISPLFFLSPPALSHASRCSLNMLFLVSMVILTTVTELLSTREGFGNLFYYLQRALDTAARGRYTYRVRSKRSKSSSIPRKRGF